MRICGGKNRNRKLITPNDNAVRPTSDKIRQAVFNMLNSRALLEDAVVLDAFCGTGALGLEALSQGAQSCTFFDVSKKSYALCKQNIENLAEIDNTNLFIQDATKIKSKPDNIEPANLIFLDPPYDKNLINKSLEALLDGGWVNQDCVFVIETAGHEIINCPLISVIHEKSYGDTKIRLAELNLQNE